MWPLNGVKKSWKPTECLLETLVQLKIVCSHHVLHMIVQNCVSSFNPQSILIATCFYICIYIWIYPDLIRICEKIVKKSVKSCYLLLITLLKFDFSDQMSLRWMHVSDWNTVWGFRRNHSFWDVMLENKYVVFQAKKYFMTLSLKVWILSLSQRLLCFWSFQ